MSQINNADEWAKEVFRIMEDLRKNEDFVLSATDETSITLTMEKLWRNDIHEFDAAIVILSMVLAHTFIATKPARAYAERAKKHGTSSDK